MRILVLANYSLLYGANRSMLSVLTHLKKMNHDVLLILPSSGPIEIELNKQEIPYKTIRMFSSFLYLKALFKYITYPLLLGLNIFSFVRLNKCVKNFKPEVIYSNTSAENFGIFLAKLNGIKHISHISM